MDNPLVSIIIPTYNRAHLIGETLDSVLAQTYINWECIIVDDGSTDNTDEVVESYVDKDSRFKYFHRPFNHNSGGNGARNFGFLMSKGEFINWFDSDDVMFSDFIKLKIEPFYNNNNLDVVFSAFNYFDKNGIQKRISNNSFSGNIINDLVSGNVTYSPLPYMLKKKAVNGYKFDESLKKAQDLDFFFNFFSTSKNINYVSFILHKVRKQHGEAIGTDNDKKGLKILSKHIVNKRILNYFEEINHINGVKKYNKEILTDYKKMVINKNYIMAIQNVLNNKILNNKQKFLIFFYVITHLLFGKGANKINKII